MITSFITFFATGLIFILLSIPLIKRKIKINNWYGIRLPQTMENEAVWYEVNEKAGRYMFLFGCLLSSVTVLLYFFPFIDEVYTIFILLTLLIAGSILLIVKSISYANRIEIQ